MLKCLRYSLSILLLSSALASAQTAVPANPPYGTQDSHTISPTAPMRWSAARGYFVPDRASLPSQVTTTLASNKQICAGPCELKGFEVKPDTNGDGYVLVYDLTAAPTDGAVTPKKCYKSAADKNFAVDFGPGLPMMVGAVVVFSSTGCFTQTLSVHAFISGEAQ